mgnify:CR=1 FL=1
MKKLAYLFAVVAAVFSIASCDEKKPTEPSKVALANHAWDEPRENERKAAEVSGIPLITCCIGEIVTL